MADCRDTLLLPFEQGILELPELGQNWVVLNADMLPQSDAPLTGLLKCEQGFRPTFLSLQDAGYQVQPSLADLSDLDGCLVLSSRSRAVNERNMTRAWNGLKRGGVLVFSGAKNSGVQAIRKWVGQRIDLGGSVSKHHAVAFWITKMGEDWPAAPWQCETGEFTVAPGMFSADGPDRGSQVLADLFADYENRIVGHVADFGAGWGYLSARLLRQCRRVEQLDLFEADWASLEAARINVGDAGAFHWIDMTREAPRGPFNWIVMNPPFHAGRGADPDLGKAFISSAARSLPAGGRLLMVANTNLPYEKLLGSLFKSVERKVQSKGFKVLEAVKGSR